MDNVKANLHPNLYVILDPRFWSWQTGVLFLIPFLRYEQLSGYRPAPVDLSQVFLTSAHEEVVNLLAENEHNVWARERIKQGWTYGAQQVPALCWFTALIRHRCSGIWKCLFPQSWHRQTRNRNLFYGDRVFWWISFRICLYTLSFRI